MNTSDQMIVGHCSFCGGIVRIPINVDVETSVRCPHCSETTRLGTILEAAVPQLEIVGNESEAGSQESEPSYELRTDLESSREKGTKFEVSPVLSKGAKRPKKRRGGRSARQRQTSASSPASSPTSSATKGDGEPLVLESTTEPTTAGVRNQASSRRSSRSRRNAFKKPRDFEMVKIVMGAVLAFPVAQLLIWWLVGADPLNMGPTVSQYAPAVVPNKFHHKFNSGSQDGGEQDDEGEAGEGETTQ